MSRVVRIARGHPLLVVAALLALAYVLFGDKLPHVDAEKLLEDVSNKLGKATYALVGVLAFLETGAFVGLVFPGETAVIIGGAVAGQGETSILLTIAIVWFGAWLGDTCSFLIGKRLGREFILRNGPRVRISNERFSQVESYFRDHGGKTILIGRFIGLVRALAPFIAGSSRMRYRGFLPFSVLGTGLWATAFSLLGYFLSNSIGRAGEIAGRGTLVFGVVVAIGVSIWVTARTLRDPVRRARLVERMEAQAALRPLLAFGRRIEPQARFAWARLTPGDLGLELTSLCAALAVALFIAVAFASIVSGDPGATAGDRTAFDVAADLNAAWFTHLNKALTVLGSTPVTVPVALVAGALLWRAERRPEAIALLAAVAIAHVAVPVLKEVIDRPRPGGGLVDAGGRSFPSGHAASAALYGWLAILAATRARRLAHAGLLVSAGVLLSAAVGLTRVYLHVHYLSDVTAGAALATAAFTGCAAAALVVSHLRDNPAGQ